MTSRRPLITASGGVAELPAGDTVPGYTVADPDALSSGESTLPRKLVVSNALATTSGGLRVTYFTATKTETTTQVRVVSGNTAAAATPTLCRVGLWTVDASDNATTLVAAIANDTTLFAAANTAYTRSWSSSYAKVAGQRYALGILVITGAATPTLPGVTLAASFLNELALVPRAGGTLTGQTDLPSSFTSASLATTANCYYAAILP